MRANPFRFQFLLAMAVTCASAWIAGSSQAQAEQSTINLRAAASLVMPVMLDLDDVPLKQAVESLAQQADVQVLWDEEALAEMDLPGEETVAVQASRKMPLNKALRLVLCPIHLMYENQGDVILITSRVKWGQRIVKARYDVRRIIDDQFTEEDFEQTFTEMLTHNVNAGTWQKQNPDKPGYMAFHNGSVEVTHRREVHEELTWWLRSLEIEVSR